MGRRVVVAVVAVLAVACTGEAPAPPTTTLVIELDSVPPITAPDAADAGARVLTAGDLPPTFTVRANSDPRTRVDAIDCADSAAGLATATGDDVVLPDGTVVAQSVSVGDPFLVDDVVARIDERCVAAAARRVVDTQIAAIPGTPREVTPGEPGVSRLQVPPSVAGVAAFEVAVPIAIDGVETVTYVDVVTIRDGDVLTILTARRPTTAPTMADLEAVARAARSTG